MSAGLTSLHTAATPLCSANKSTPLYMHSQFHVQELKILKDGKDLTQASGYGTSQNTNVFIGKL